MTIKAIMNPLTTQSYFPFSNTEGTPLGNINKKRMMDLAKQNAALSKPDLQKLVEKHLDFLMNGGAGGSWKTILVNGLVLGIYEGRNASEGEQATFERSNISKRSLENVILPFSNFCACFAESVLFKEADLSYSLFTDAFLSGADFRNANLSKVDFSRAELKNADFRAANISGADFENCDLSGADFRNTNLQNARFPGAKLTNVKF